ncbi:Protein kinase [Extremus antarcticus]|uniref:Protein kinase n=1 Tax=Extremus antarcticus TaxID=702011 RepID=A0AAJ0D4T2_9PEZI|nr:Protein kinase [Extremus antarcticus]
MSGILIGDYHVFEPFASGSVGTVHYVTHTVTGKPYALKRIKRRHYHDERAIQNEIEILRTISHAHACRVVEVFTQRFDGPDIR